MRAIKSFFVALALVIGLLAVFFMLRQRQDAAVPQLISLQTKKLPASRSWSLGCFQMRWDATKPEKAQLRVQHCLYSHTLWSSYPGKGFVAAAVGQEKVHESRGSFVVEDDLKLRCEQQTIESFTETSKSLTVQGHLHCEDGSKSPYRLRFLARTPKQLGFSFEVFDKRLNRTFLRYQSNAEERFFGFGEQFTHVEMKGRRLPIFIMEQGIGRGVEPLSTAATLLAGRGVAGAWHTSYAGVPHYITSQMRSLYLTNYEYSVFDMRPDHFVEIGLFSSKLRGVVLAGRTPLELISGYAEYAGKMRPLPDWILQGAVIGMQGGTQAVRKALQDLKKHDTPISAFWLQDWVGQRKTSFGKQLWWNWELDRDRYPQWTQLRGELQKAGARVMTYINPFLVDMRHKDVASNKKRFRRNLFKEAQDAGYLIKDHHNKPYMIPNTSFSAGLLDLTNPQARTWIKKVIKDEMIRVGSSGWMADFGEALPYDARLFSKESPSTYHNRYPEEWAKVNREAIEEAKRGGDIVFFMRSGYTQSPRFSTLFWLGDQLVTWDIQDGLKTAITGLVSGGFSGYSLNHSDIGGYTTITNPLQNYHRSKELMLRWIELNAFTTIFRTHEGNQPSKNHQFNTDEETLRHFSRFAKIYKAWGFYRKILVNEAATHGWPVVRHPFLHYPEDPTTQRLEFLQFMVGSELMVAPVSDPGVRVKDVYLPQGRWVHLWTGQLYDTRRQGRWFRVPAPLGQPPVFYKKGGSIGEHFHHLLKQRRLLLPTASQKH
ncbi:MAG: alpha-glucosidase [Myxococcales bacterium]|nr:alpha-glucosidase [Myxococcales bacterium]